MSLALCISTLIVNDSWLTFKLEKMKLYWPGRVALNINKPSLFFLMAWMTLRDGPNIYTSIMGVFSLLPEMNIPLMMRDSPGNTSS